MRLKGFVRRIVELGEKETAVDDGSAPSKVIDQSSGRNDPSPGQLLNGMRPGLNKMDDSRSNEARLSPREKRSTRRNGPGRFTPVQRPDGSLETRRASKLMAGPSAVGPRRAITDFIFHPSGRGACKRGRAKGKRRSERERRHFSRDAPTRHGSAAVKMNRLT